MRRFLFGISIVVAGLASARSAYAVNSGRLVNTDSSGLIQYFYLGQAPNETWTIQTSNLAGGPIPDTVLHIQDYFTGRPINGDDDGGGGLSSRVVVTPSGSTRSLAAVIRAWDTSRYGTCTLTATSSLGTVVTYADVSFGGTRYDVGDLASGTHVTTAERRDGTPDTVVLAVTNTTYAVAFDDEAGVGSMAWLHLDEQCQSCSIIVGNYNYTGTLKTDLIWDGDADSTDYDGDGLGATLEAAIGTCPGPDPCPVTSAPPSDTDMDGLLDGPELLGFENASLWWLPVKLPAWGADPFQKDVFIEIDWQKCNSTDPNLCPSGAGSGKTGVGWTDAQFKTNYIDPLKADLAPGGFRVHLDIGRANTDSATWYDWGDFGGAATQLETGDGCGLTGNSDERAYMFHHSISIPADATNCCFSCSVPAPMFTTDVNDYLTVAHEFGHNLGLTHGGRPSAIAINYKPHYRSRMNYTYNYDASTGFSHGDAPVLTLNPNAVNEKPGLGDIGTTRLTALRNAWCPVLDYNQNPPVPIPYSNGKCVQIDGNAGPLGTIPKGSVDWNRDGTYAQSGTAVQGTVAGGGFITNGASGFASNGSFLTDPALTWVDVGGSVGNQLWIFGRDASNQLVFARKSKTALDAGCGGPFGSWPEGFGDCAGLGATTTLAPGPVTLATSVAPGAAEYGSTSNKQILLVFQRTTAGQTIRAKLVTINSTSGNVTFGSDMTLPGAKVATGDITAVKISATEVRVYAPYGSGPSARLHEWRYQNGSWSNSGSGLGDQVWSDGQNIVPTFGVGATRGFQDGSSTALTYAAIPHSPDNLIEFASKSNTTPFRWSRVTFTCPSCSSNCPPESFQCPSGTASSWAGVGGAGLPPNGTQPRALGRPGLAYQKRAGGADSVGRFYMMFNQGSNCSGKFGTSPSCGSMLIMTEGNLATGTPTSRRLTWILPPFGIDGGNTVSTGVSLIDDLTRDTNLRAFYTTPPNGTVRTGLFMPLADGIINAPLKDFDDYPHLSGGLRASLCVEGGTWPGIWPQAACLLPANLQ